MSQHFRDFLSISPETSVWALYEAESDARNSSQRAACVLHAAARQSL